MGTKGSYKLFFAIPFDCDTRCIYEYVVKEIQKKYKAKKLVCVTGNEQIGTATQYKTIETFKMQNSELFRCFVKQIRDADIVVADLTDNNPNVHVELGIALFYNKNILRVTRHSYEKLGFDVRNYQVSQYKLREDLLNKIVDYLNLFFKIKGLNFRKENSDLYYYYSHKRKLRCLKDGKEKKTGENIFDRYSIDFQMRDGEVRVTFNISDYTGKEDKGWFGVFLRVCPMGPFLGSCVVYVRGDGNLEISTFPEHKLVGPERLCNKKRLNDKELTLIIQLEGNSVKASIADENIHLEHSRLDIQSRGSVMFGCWNSNAEFWDTQIVCRDAIGAFDIFE